MSTQGARRPGGSRRLTRKRLLGFDRSGPPPDATLSGRPLNPWTIPNAIGYLRLAGIPVFLVIAFSSVGGQSALAAWIYFVIGWADYLDGFAARLTGQYSRLGALLDPVIDRLLVISGMVVCWHFELLPRWAIALVIARELFVLALSRYGIRRGLELRINWPGRLGVPPTMGAPFFAMVGVHWFALVCLYLGLGFMLVSTAMYVRDGLRQQRARKLSSSA